MKKLLLGLFSASIMLLFVLFFIPMSADAAITFGTEDDINQDASTHVSISSLDSTHFVITYSDTGNSNYGTAAVCETSGTSITSCGTSSVFETSNTNDISVVGLDSSHFAVAYDAPDADKTGRASVVIGNVSGTSITSYGTKQNFVPEAGSDYNSIAKFSSSKFVIAYQGNDAGAKQAGSAVIGDVSGDSITLGSEYDFDTDVSTYITTSVMDSTHFVAGYSDTGNSNYGTAVIGSVSGTTILYGSTNVFNSATTSYIDVTGFDNAHFAITYLSSNGYVVIGNASGTSISSYGTPVLLSQSGGSDYKSIDKLSSSKFVVTWRAEIGGKTGPTGRAATGTISGDVITLGTDLTFNGTDDATYQSVSAIDSEYFVIGYTDVGNSNYSTGIIGFEQQEGGAVPELPKNNLWKILIAMLALGLVIGVATYRKKKGTLNKPEKK